MPQWKQYSGIWTPTQQAQAIAAGTWTGLPQYELYSWGINDIGQLGQGNVINQSSPIQVGTLTTWSDIARGQNQTVATTTDGKLYAWGQGEFGQTGQGDVIDRSSPVQVGALTNWKTVTASVESSYAIKTDGTLWAFGSDGNGRLGLNTSSVARSSPVQVGSLTTWSKVRAGWYDCAAIKTDGSLWVWGRNDAGQLGLNSVLEVSSPTQVGALTTWSEVVSGRRFRLAVKTDNTLWAWGENYFSGGQLGLGDVIYRSSPVQVGALTNWAKPACAREASFCVKTDNTLWSWGNGASGATGHGNATDKSSPVQVGSLTNWSQPSGIQYGAFCRKTDGTLWSWGRDDSGGLGHNNQTDLSSPVQVGSLTNWGTIVSQNQGSGGFLAILETRTGV